MVFKRLNNMTGKDPVMNRRIASIFLNDFEAFKELFQSITLPNQMGQVQFMLHKIKPSLVIFEMDELLEQYEEMLAKVKSGIAISEDNEELVALIKESNNQIARVRNFLSSL
jgi:hypothetical protein